MSRNPARLFVAVPVPGAVTRQLAALQPAAGMELRLSAQPDMHLTLHFLGAYDPDSVAVALSQLRLPAFPLLPGPLGSFALSGGRHVLWSGIEPSPPLLDLHAATAAALATVQFVAETRPWVPHITLARLGPRADPGLITAFLQQPPLATGFACRAYALYASEAQGGAVRYRQLASWPLSGG